ncbi:cyclic nucleotide-gated ion channel [Aureococcus anophagefferens]|nr:cyclic nucleotide-gated ion channel [Aureococcus anophagefferens]
MDATRSERVRHLEQIQTFLRSRNIPSRTLNKVVSYYQYLWLCGDGSGVEKLMRDIPRTLKAEIDLYLKRRLIESVPFFRTCSVAEILTVVQSLRPRIMMPKDYIIRQGDQGDETIVRATPTSSSPRPACLTSSSSRCQGQFFGESALMEGDIAVRNASVRSEGFSELMSLSRADFREMTIQFPHFKEFVQKLARERARAKKEKEDKEREKSGSGRRGSMVRRESSRMGTLRRSISSIRTNTVVDRSPSVSGRGGGDSSTDGEARRRRPSPAAGAWAASARACARRPRGSISGLVGKRGSLTPADAPIVEGEEKGGDEPAAPPSPNSPRSPAPTSTTETLIDRMHARGHLSRGLSRNASMGDRQSSTASRASAGSGGKGDGETASLKLEEADGDGDGAGRRAGPRPDDRRELRRRADAGPSRAPPKRGNMRANSINLISSGMDRLPAPNPSVENRASGSVFDEVARSLERAPVEAITGGSPLLGPRR